MEPCKKCNGRLVVEDKVLFCENCLEVVDRDYRKSDIDFDILKAREDGLSWQKVGESVGLSCSAVYRRFDIAFGRAHDLKGRTPLQRRRQDTTFLAYSLRKEGYKYPEIAKMLNITEVAARQKVFRLKRKERNDKIKTENFGSC